MRVSAALTASLAVLASSMAQTMHVVSVGGNSLGLKFKPETLVALPGDLVQFQFWPKNVRSAAPELRLNVHC